MEREDGFSSWRAGCSSPLSVFGLWSTAGAILGAIGRKGGTAIAWVVIFVVLLDGTELEVFHRKGIEMFLVNM